MKKFLLFILTTLLSCQGKNDSDEVAPYVRPVDETTIRKYTGSVFLNSSTSPAAGYKMVLLNQTQSSFDTLEVRNTGQYDIPVQYLRRFETYSLQLIDERHQHIGTVTIFGQPTFSYTGGEGVELDPIIVSKDSFGVVNLLESDTDISEVEGIVSTLTEGGFDQISIPSGFSSLKIGSHLVINDPNVLLNAFHRSTISDKAYQEAIREWTAVHIEGILDDPETNKVTGGILLEGSSEIKKSLIRIDKDLGPLKQPSWDSQKFNLEIDQNEVQTVLYTLKVLKPDTVLSFDVVYQNATDTRQRTVSKYIDKVGTPISFPPLVLGIAQNTSTPVAIDYSGDVLENGLTIPFCRTTGDVILEMSAALDFDSNPFNTEDLENAVIKFEYLIDDGEKLVPAEIETNEENDPLASSDFPSGLTSKFSTLQSGVTRTWDPHNQTLTINFSANTPMANHELDIYGNAFLTTIPSLNNETVEEVRLQITYSGAKHKAGIVTRFEYCGK